MLDSKVATIVRSLDVQEVGKCRKFLQSPYFNPNPGFVKLYDILVKASTKQSTVSKEEIWKKIVPDRTYDDVRFRKLCSDLSKLIEKFLAQEKYESDTIQHTLFLMQSVGDKNIDKLKNSVFRYAQSLSKKSPYRDTSFHLYQYLIEKQFYEVLDFDTRRGDKSNIEDISLNLDLLYFSEKLRIMCNALTRTNVKSHEYEFTIQQDIIELLEKHINSLVKHSPAIEIYYRIFLMFNELDNESHYYQLKNSLERLAHFFPANVAIEEMYTFAQNYCVRRINSGDSKYLHELFELFLMLIDSKMIIASGQINPWYFRNIITVALRLGKYDWAEKFVLEYSEYLPAALKDNALSFNLAQIYFYQKRYGKVIEKLRDVEYDDISYTLNSRVLLLLSYYELDEDEPLYSLIESFRSYLNRQKDLPTKKVRDYLNFIKFVKRLIKLIPGDNRQIQKLKEEIKAEKGAVNADWLLEKLSRLEG